MKANGATTRGIKRTLAGWTRAYAAHDLGACLDHVVPDADVAFIGTGADEERYGRAALRAGIRRDFAQTSALKLVLSRVVLSARGPVAWLHCRAVFHAVTGGRRVALKGRLTLVLEQRGGRWLIAQGHLSEPTGTQRRGRSF